MPEGSVIVDGRDADVSDATEETQETSETSTEAEEPASSTEESSEAQALVETTTETPSESVDSEQKLTDKGTKLDPDPLTAAHQQLANERRQRLQYEEILNNPTRYMELARQAGLLKDEDKVTPVAQPQVTKQFTVEDVQSAEDVAKLLNELNGAVAQTKQSYEKQVQELEQKVAAISEQRRAEGVANSIQSDGALVREKYPELKPGSPYAKELEKEIAKRYHQLNWNEQAMEYTNAYPLSMVAEMVITPIRLAKTQAVDQAQTIVRQKGMGKVVTSGKVSEEETSGDSIAAIISKQSRR